MRTPPLPLDAPVSFVRFLLKIQDNFDKYVAATYLQGRDATDPTALEGATIKAESLDTLSIEAMQVCEERCRSMCRSFSRRMKNLRGFNNH